MPERFKVVCIPCKALYKCSAFSLYIVMWYVCIIRRYQDVILRTSDVQVSNVPLPQWQGDSGSTSCHGTPSLSSIPLSLLRHCTLRQELTHQQTRQAQTSWQRTQLPVSPWWRNGTVCSLCSFTLYLKKTVCFWLALTRVGQFYTIRSLPSPILMTILWDFHFTLKIKV